MDTAKVQRSALRVLVVDDNRDYADTLGMLLALWGYAPQVTYRADAALDSARRARPDMILLDLGLPLMDGYRLTQAFRREAAFHDIPLIAITGFADEAHRLHSRRAGFDHYLVKPVNPEELHGLLTQLCESTVRPGG
jgi:DNA-binding response OmpR family regulator